MKKFNKAGKTSPGAIQSPPFDINFCRLRGHFKVACSRVN